MPLTAGNFPNPGELITLTDSSTVSDTTAAIYVRILRYDFVGRRIEIEGEGALS